MGYFTIEETRHLISAREKLLHAIGNALPHGSGIDCDWVLKFTSPSRVRASNSYHCMDQYGGYDGWIDFSVLFDIHDRNYFRIMVHGNASRWKAEKYSILDYLYEDIEWHLQKQFGDGPIKTPNDYRTGGNNNG